MRPQPLAQLRRHPPAHAYSPQWQRDKHRGDQVPGDRNVLEGRPQAGHGRTKVDRESEDYDRGDAGATGHRSSSSSRFGASGPRQKMLGGSGVSDISRLTYIRSIVQAVRDRISGVGRGSVITDAFADLDRYIGLPRVSGLCLAPDGARLAVAVATPDSGNSRYITALWEVDPRGVRPARQLTRSIEGDS